MESIDSRLMNVSQIEFFLYDKTFSNNECIYFISGYPLELSF